MNINVLITGALYSSQSGYSGLKFCQSAVLAGHTISQVFFYQDGVSQANSLSMPLDDEFEAVSQWRAFSESHSVPLFVCVSAAERRGIMSDEQVLEHHLGSSEVESKDANGNLGGNIHSSINVAGLGVLHQASLDSDRTVTFK